MPLLMGDCKIIFIDGIWRVLPKNSFKAQILELPTPTASFEDFIEPVTGDIADDYYYRFELRTHGYRKGIVSEEYHYVKTSGDDTATKISIAGALKGSVLTIYKGTQTNVYTNWAEIVLKHDILTPVSINNGLSVFLSNQIKSLRQLLQTKVVLPAMQPLFLENLENPVLLVQKARQKLSKMVIKLKL